MNTKRIMRKNTLMIAHRGVSGLETENTSAAFVAAGNRSYYGIETDVHRTRDGKYILIHDDFTARVAVDNLAVEESSFENLRALQLLDRDGTKGRRDLKMPSLEEYISICKRYEKTAVLEFKRTMLPDAIWEIVSIIRKMDYLDHVIFISFSLDNLIALHRKYPEQPAQLLVCADFVKGHTTEQMIEILSEHHLDIDTEFTAVTADSVQKFHEAGIKVNVWTPDSIEDGGKMINYGVDFITSNILE